MPPITGINYTINPETNEPYNELNVSVRYGVHYVGEVTDGRSVFYQFECQVCSTEEFSWRKKHAPRNRWGLRVLKQDGWDICNPCAAFKDKVSEKICGHEVSPKPMKLQHDAHNEKQAQPAPAASTVAADVALTNRVLGETSAEPVAPSIPEQVSEQQPPTSGPRYDVFGPVVAEVLDTVAGASNFDPEAAQRFNNVLRLNLHDKELEGVWAAVRGLNEEMQANGNQVCAKLNEVCAQITYLHANDRSAVHMFTNAVTSLATSQKMLEGVVNELSQQQVPQLMEHFRSSMTVFTSLQTTVEQLQSGQLSTSELYKTMQTKLEELGKLQTSLAGDVLDLKTDVEQLKEEKKAEADEQARLAELKARKDAFLREAQAEERKIADAKAKAMEEAKEKAREKRFGALEKQQEEAKKKQKEMAQQQEEILKRQEEAEKKQEVMDAKLKMQQQHSGEVQDSILARLTALEIKERRRSNQARLQKALDAQREEQLEKELQLKSAVKLQKFIKRALLRVKCARFIEACKSSKAATTSQDEAYNALKASVESGDVPDLSEMHEAAARVSSAVKAQERARAAIIGPKIGKARALVATPLAKRDANAAMHMR